MLNRAFSLKKALAILVSGVLLYEALGIPLSEASLWSDRRKAWETRVKNQNKDVQLASLPAALQPFQAEKILNQFPTGKINSLSSSLSRKFVDSNGNSQKIAGLLNALPTNLGTVRKISIPESGIFQKVVVHIQDVHQNLEAQKNISKAISSLADHREIGLVALEGGFGEIDFSAFRKFPHPALVRESADYLLSQNEIQGPVHAGLVDSKMTVPFIGVDDADHYEANVNAYRQSAPVVQNFKTLLAKEVKNIETRKVQVFNKDLCKFDSEVQAYKHGKMEIGDFIRILYVIARPQRGRSNLINIEIASSLGNAPRNDRFTNMELLLKGLELEKSINFAQVEVERVHLVKRLVEKLNKTQIEGLVGYSAAFRMGRVAQSDFYEFLTELCQQVRLPLSQFPAMDSYIRYVLLSERIDIEKLLSEVSNLEKDIYAGLARTEAEKELVRYSEKLNLTAKLLDFSLTPEEWKTYSASSLRGRMYQETPSSILEEGQLSSFEAFYKEASKRDSAVMQNLMKGMAAKRANAAILVTGGFHSSGINRALLDKGAAVITFVPRITQVSSSEGTAYLSVFTQEKTPLEKLFEGEKLFLSKKAWTGLIKFATASTAIGLGLLRGVISSLSEARVWWRGFFPKLGVELVSSRVRGFSAYLTAKNPRNNFNVTARVQQVPGEAIAVTYAPSLSMADSLVQVRDAIGDYYSRFVRSPAAISVALLVIFIPLYFFVFPLISNTTVLGWFFHFTGTTVLRLMFLTIGAHMIYHLPHSAKIANALLGTVSNKTVSDIKVWGQAALKEIEDYRKTNPILGGIIHLPIGLIHTMYSFGFERIDRLYQIVIGNKNNLKELNWLEEKFSEAPLIPQIFLLPFFATVSILHKRLALLVVSSISRVVLIGAIGLALWAVGPLFGLGGAASAFALSSILNFNILEFFWGTEWYHQAMASGPVKAASVQLFSVFSIANSYSLSLFLSILSQAKILRATQQAGFFGSYLKAVNIFAPVLDKTGKASRTPLWQAAFSAFGLEGVHMVGLEVEFFKLLGESSNSSYVHQSIQDVEGEEGILGSGQKVVHQMGIDPGGLVKYLPGTEGLTEQELMQLKNLEGMVPKENFDPNALMAVLKSQTADVLATGGAGGGAGGGDDGPKLAGISPLQALLISALLGAQPAEKDPGAKPEAPARPSVTAPAQVPVRTAEAIPAGSKVEVVRLESGASALKVNGELWTGAPGFAYQPVPDGTHINQFESGHLASLYKALLPEGGKGIDPKKYPDLVQLARSQVGAPAQDHARILAEHGTKFIRTYNLAATTDRDLQTVSRIFQWMHETHGIMFVAGMYNPSLSDIQKISALKSNPGLLMYDGWNEIDMRQGTTPETYGKIDTLAGQLKRLDPNHPVGIVLSQALKASDLRAVKATRFLDVVGFTIYDRDGADTARFISAMQKNLGPKAVGISEIGVKVGRDPAQRAARLADIARALTPTQKGQVSATPFFTWFEFTPEKWKGNDNMWWFFEPGKGALPELSAVGKIQNQWKAGPSLKDVKTTPAGGEIPAPMKSVPDASIQQPPPLPRQGVPDASGKLPAQAPQPARQGEFVIPLGALPPALKGPQPAPLAPAQQGADQDVAPLKIGEEFSFTTGGVEGLIVSHAEESKIIEDLFVDKDGQPVKDNQSRSWQLVRNPKGEVISVDIYDYKGSLAARLLGDIRINGQSLDANRFDKATGKLIPFVLDGNATFEADLLMEVKFANVNGEIRKVGERLYGIKYGLGYKFEDSQKRSRVVAEVIQPVREINGEKWGRLRFNLQNYKDPPSVEKGGTTSGMKLEPFLDSTTVKSENPDEVKVRVRDNNGEQWFEYYNRPSQKNKEFERLRKEFPNGDKDIYSNAPGVFNPVSCSWIPSRVAIYRDGVLREAREIVTEKGVPLIDEKGRATYNVETFRTYKDPKSGTMKSISMTKTIETFETDGQLYIRVQPKKISPDLLKKPTVKAHGDEKIIFDVERQRDIYARTGEKTEIPVKAFAKDETGETPLADFNVDVKFSNDPRNPHVESLELTRKSLIEPGVWVKEEYLRPGTHDVFGRHTGMLRLRTRMTAQPDAVNGGERIIVEKVFYEDDSVDSVGFPAPLKAAKASGEFKATGSKDRELGRISFLRQPDGQSKPIGHSVSRGLLDVSEYVKDPEWIEKLGGFAVSVRTVYGYNAKDAQFDKNVWLEFHQEDQVVGRLDLKKGVLSYKRPAGTAVEDPAHPDRSQEGWNDYKFADGKVAKKPFRYSVNQDAEKIRPDFRNAVDPKVRISLQRLVKAFRIYEESSEGADKYKWKEDVLLDAWGNALATITEDPLDVNPEKMVINIDLFEKADIDPFLAKPEKRITYKYDRKTQAVDFLEVLGESFRADPAKYIDLFPRPTDTPEQAKIKQYLSQPDVNFFEIRDYRQRLFWFGFFDVDHENSPLAKIRGREGAYTLHIPMYKKDLEKAATREKSSPQKEREIRYPGKEDIDEFKEIRKSPRYNRLKDLQEAGENTYDLIPFNKAKASLSHIGHRTSISRLNISLTDQDIASLKTQLSGEGPKNNVFKGLKDRGYAFARRDAFKNIVDQLDQALIYDIQPLYYQDDPREIKTFTSFFSKQQELMKIDHSWKRLGVKIHAKDRPWEERAGIDFDYRKARPADPSPTIGEPLSLSVALRPSELPESVKARHTDPAVKIEDRLVNFIIDIRLNLPFIEFRDKFDGAVLEVENGLYRGESAFERHKGILSSVLDGDLDAAGKNIFPVKEFIPFANVTFNYRDFQIVDKNKDGKAVPGKFYSAAYLRQMGIPYLSKAFLFDSEGKPVTPDKADPHKETSFSTLFNLEMVPGKGIRMESFRQSEGWHRNPQTGEEGKLYTARIEVTNEQGIKSEVHYGNRPDKNFVGSEVITKAWVEDPANFRRSLIFRAFVDVDGKLGKYKIADKTVSTVVLGDLREYLFQKSNSATKDEFGYVTYKTQRGFQVKLDPQTGILKFQPIAFGEDADGFDKYKYLGERLIMEDPNHSHFREMRFSALTATFVEKKNNRGHLEAVLYGHKEVDPVTGYVIDVEGASLVEFLEYQGLKGGQVTGLTFYVLLFHEGIPNRGDTFPYVKGHNEREQYSSWNRVGLMDNLELDGSHINFDAQNDLYGKALKTRAFNDDGRPYFDGYRSKPGGLSETRVHFSGLTIPDYSVEQNRDGSYAEPVGVFDFGVTELKDASGQIHRYLIVIERNPWSKDKKTEEGWVVIEDGRFLASNIEEWENRTQEFRTVLDLVDNTANSMMIRGEYKRPEVRTALSAIEKAKKDGTMVQGELPEDLGKNMSPFKHWSRLIIYHGFPLFVIPTLLGIFWFLWWLIGNQYRFWFFRVPTKLLRGLRERTRRIPIVNLAVSGLWGLFGFDPIYLNTAQERNLEDIFSKRDAGEIVSYRQRVGVIQNVDDLYPAQGPPVIKDMTKRKFDRIKWRLNVANPQAVGAITQQELLSIQNLNAINQQILQNNPILHPIQTYILDLIQRGFLTNGQVLAKIQDVARRTPAGAMTKSAFAARVLQELFRIAYWDDVGVFRNSTKQIIRSEVVDLFRRSGVQASDSYIENIMKDIATNRPPEFLWPLENPFEGDLSLGIGIWIPENTLGHYRARALEDFILEYKIIYKRIEFLGYDTPVVRWLARECKRLLLMPNPPMTVDEFLQSHREFLYVIEGDQKTVKVEEQKDILSPGKSYEPGSSTDPKTKAKQEKRNREVLKRWRFLLVPEEAHDLFRFVMGEDDNGRLPNDLLVDPQFQALRQQVLDVLADVARPGGPYKGVNWAGTLVKNTKAWAPNDDVQKLVDEKFKPFILYVRDHLRIPRYENKRGGIFLRIFTFWFILLDSRFWTGRDADTGTVKARRAQLFWIFGILAWLFLVGYIAFHAVYFMDFVPLPSKIVLFTFEINLPWWTQWAFLALSFLPLLKMFKLSFPGIVFLFKGPVRWWASIKNDLSHCKSYQDAIGHLPEILYVAGDPPETNFRCGKFRKTIESMYRRWSITDDERTNFLNLIDAIQHPLPGAANQRQRVNNLLQPLSSLGAKSMEQSFKRFINKHYMKHRPFDPKSLFEMEAITRVVTAFGDDPWTEFPDLNKKTGLQTPLGMLASSMPDEWDVLLSRLSGMIPRDSDEEKERARLMMAELEALKTQDDKVLTAALFSGDANEDIREAIEYWANMRTGTGLLNIQTAAENDNIVYDHHLERLMPGATLEQREAQRDTLLFHIFSNDKYNQDIEAALRSLLSSPQLDLNDFIANLRGRYLAAKRVTPTLTAKSFVRPYLPSIFYTMPDNKSNGRKNSKILRVIVAAVEHNIYLSSGRFVTEDATHPYAKSNVGDEKYTSVKGNAQISRGVVAMNDIDQYQPLEEEWDLMNAGRLFRIDPKLAAAPYNINVVNKRTSRVAMAMGGNEEGWIHGEQFVKIHLDMVLFYGRGLQSVPWMRRTSPIFTEYVAEDAAGAMAMASQGAQTTTLNLLDIWKTMPNSLGAAITPLFKWCGDAIETLMGVMGIKYLLSPNIPWYKKFGNFLGGGFRFYINKPDIVTFTKQVIIIFYVLNLNPWFGLPFAMIFNSLLIMYAITYAGFSVFAEKRYGWKRALFFEFWKAIIQFFFIFSTTIIPRYGDSARRGEEGFAKFIRTAFRSGPQVRESMTDLYILMQSGIRSGVTLTLLVVFSSFDPIKFLEWSPQIAMVFFGWWCGSFYLNPKKKYKPASGFGRWAYPLLAVVSTLLLVAFPFNIILVMGSWWPRVYWWLLIIPAIRMIAGFKDNKIQNRFWHPLGAGLMGLLDQFFWVVSHLQQLFSPLRGLPRAFLIGALIASASIFIGFNIWVMLFLLLAPFLGMGLVLLTYWLFMVIIDWKLKEKSPPGYRQRMFDLRGANSPRRDFRRRLLFDTHRLVATAVFRVMKVAMKRAGDLKMDKMDPPPPALTWLNQFNNQHHYSLRGYVEGRIEGNPSLIALFMVMLNTRRVLKGIADEEARLAAVPPAAPAAPTGVAPAGAVPGGAAANPPAQGAPQGPQASSATGGGSEPTAGPAQAPSEERETLRQIWRRFVGDGKIKGSFVYPKPVDPGDPNQEGDEIEFGLHIEGDQIKFFGRNATQNRELGKKVQQKKVGEFDVRQNEYRALKPGAAVRMQDFPPHDPATCNACQGPIRFSAREKMRTQEINGVVWETHYNIAPNAEEGSVMYIPNSSDPAHQRGQIFTQQDADAFVVIDDDEPEFVKFFQTLRAGASLNHIHMQAWHNPESLLIETKPLETVLRMGGVTISQVQNYPATTLVFEGWDRPELARTLFQYVDHLQKNNIAFNLMRRTGGKVFVTLRDRDKEITSVFPGIKIGGAEIIGLFNFDFYPNLYESVTEAEIKLALSMASLNPETARELLLGAFHLEVLFDPADTSYTTLWRRLVAEGKIYNRFEDEKTKDVIETGVRLNSEHQTEFYGGNVTKKESINKRVLLKVVMGFLVIVNQFVALKPGYAAQMKVLPPHDTTKCSGCVGDRSFRARRERGAILKTETLNNRLWEVHYNIAPLFKDGHILYIPDTTNPNQARPQIITREDAMDFVRMGEGEPSYVKVFNSPGAGASLNHIHFQGYFYPDPYLIETKDVDVIAQDGRTNIGRVRDFSATGVVFENRDLDQLAESVFKFVDYLQTHKIAFNLFRRTGGRVYVFPRDRNFEITPQFPQSKLGADQMAGSMVLQGADVEKVNEVTFDELSTSVRVTSIPWENVEPWLNRIFTPGAQGPNAGGSWLPFETHPNYFEKAYWETPLAFALPFIGVLVDFAFFGTGFAPAYWFLAPVLFRYVHLLKNPEAIGSPDEVVLSRNKLIVAVFAGLLTWSGALVLALPLTAILVFNLTRLHKDIQIKAILKHEKMATRSSLRTAEGGEAISPIIKIASPPSGVRNDTDRFPQTADVLANMQPGQSMNLKSFDRPVKAGRNDSDKSVFGSKIFGIGLILFVGINHYLSGSMPGLVSAALAISFLWIMSLFKSERESQKGVRRILERLLNFDPVVERLEERVFMSADPVQLPSTLFIDSDRLEADYVVGPSPQQDKGVVYSGVDSIQFNGGSGSDVFNSTPDRQAPLFNSLNPIAVDRVFDEEFEVTPSVAALNVSPAQFVPNNAVVANEVPEEIARKAIEGKDQVMTLKVLPNVFYGNPPAEFQNGDYKIYQDGDISTVVAGDHVYYQVTIVFYPNDASPNPNIDPVGELVLGPVDKSQNNPRNTWSTTVLIPAKDIIRSNFNAEVTIQLPKGLPADLPADYSQGRFAVTVGSVYISPDGKEIRQVDFQKPTDGVNLKFRDGVGSGAYHYQSNGVILEPILDKNGDVDFSIVASKVPASLATNRTATVYVQVSQGLNGDQYRVQITQTVGDYVIRATDYAIHANYHQGYTEPLVGTDIGVRLVRINGWDASKADIPIDQISVFAIIDQGRPIDVPLNAYIMQPIKWEGVIREDIVGSSILPGTKSIIIHADLKPADYVKVTLTTPEGYLWAKTLKPLPAKMLLEGYEVSIVGMNVNGIGLERLQKMPDGSFVGVPFGTNIPTFAVFSTSKAQNPILTEVVAPQFPIFSTTPFNLGRPQAKIMGDVLDLHYGMGLSWAFLIRMGWAKSGYMGGGGPAYYDTVNYDEYGRRRLFKGYPYYTPITIPMPLPLQHRLADTSTLYPLDYYERFDQLSNFITTAGMENDVQVLVRDIQYVSGQYVSINLNVGKDADVFVAIMTDAGLLFSMEDAVKYGSGVEIVMPEGLPTETVDVMVIVDTDGKIVNVEGLVVAPSSAKPSSSGAHKLTKADPGKIIRVMKGMKNPAPLPQGDAQPLRREEKDVKPLPQGEQDGEQAPQAEGMKEQMSEQEQQKGPISEIALDSPAGGDDTNTHIGNTTPENNDPRPSSEEGVRNSDENSWTSIIRTVGVPALVVAGIIGTILARRLTKPQNKKRRQIEVKEDDDKGGKMPPPAADAGRPGPKADDSKPVLGQLPVGMVVTGKLADAVRAESVEQKRHLKLNLVLKGKTVNDIQRELDELGGSLRGEEGGTVDVLVSIADEAVLTQLQTYASEHMRGVNVSVKMASQFVDLASLEGLTKLSSGERAHRVKFLIEQGADLPAGFLKNILKLGKMRSYKDILSVHIILGVALNSPMMTVPSLEDLLSPAITQLFGSQS